ncbi:methylated-DNA--[protein]-cysteine S-methyltransferase [Pseudomonas sp. R5(2019)]|uniref:methylated-DNA--[protein]-cysteine S-methyltransferase n=1 Tax=Pseudomonas sp. R5(2019) TaxID=2697566 RepID=UPI002114BB0B|nr:methylated-DNA--[protein]-cysteine S-methyltransferase [Pseudomonas sp. R5(2019)]
MTPLPLLFTQIDWPAPMGPVLIVANHQALLALDFDHPHDRLMRLLRVRFGADVCWVESRDLAQVTRPLQAYFEGDLEALNEVAIDGGGSVFQRKVWEALRTIPAGETRSYGQIAEQIGSPGAARAVGLANSLNPISLVVPCHRVIGSSGALTGYGGGIERKRWLLAHERRGSLL